MTNDISGRITQAREAAGISKSELARKLGVTPQSVYDWEQGNTAPRGKRLNELADALGVSVHWLAFGEESARAITDRDSLVVAVPLMESHPSAGGGEECSNVAIRMIELAKKWLRDHLNFTNFLNLRIFITRGDSMEPTLHSGDPVLVDVGVKSFDDDGVYVARLDDRIYIKRFQYLPGRKLLMVSDNPRYQPVTISPEDNFEILGRSIYFWHGSPLK